MKKFLLTGIALAFTASGAFAADIAEPVAYDWTGVYISLQGGYGWGDNDAKAKYDFELPNITSDDVSANGGKGSIGVDGFIGGLNAGYNWQADSFVFGFEGDLEFADISGNTDIVDRFDDKIGKMKEDIDWLGSLRLRGGLAADRALFYVTGGLAAGGVELSLHDNDNGSISNNSTEWGWTLGAGVEYAFTDDLSARIEYRYTDLGSIEENKDFGPVRISGKSDITFNAIRAGLSWHF